MKEKSKRLSKAFECYIDRILKVSYDVNKKMYFDDYEHWKALVINSLELKGFYIAICKKVLKSVIDNLYQVCFDLRGLTMSLNYDTWCERVSHILKERGFEKC